MAKEDWVDGDQVNAAALNALGGDINDAEESSDIAALAAQVADDLDPAALLALSEDLALADDDAFVMFDSTAGNTLKRAKWSTFKSGLVTLFGNKVDKDTGVRKIYATNSSGVQANLNWDQAAAVSSVAVRQANGALTVATTVAQSDTATKQYVDNAMHLADACTVSGETYTIVNNAVTQINGLVVDGVTLGVGAKVLIRNAPTVSGAAGSGSAVLANGLYTVTSIAGGNLAVARAAEMSGTVNPVGHMIRILNGTAYGPGASTIVTCNAPTLATNFVGYGTTALAFADYFLGWIATQGRINTQMGSGRGLRGIGATSAATYTINVDTYDYWRILTQAVDVTSVAIAGSPFNGHMLTLEWADNGTQRNITHGTSFANGTAPMATKTIVGSTIRETFRYNAWISKYECVECTIESVPRTKLTEHVGPSTPTGFIPPGAVGVRATLRTGGFGGASGRRGAAGTVRTGGAGASGLPCIVERYFPIPAGTTTYSAVLGAAGVGGAAVTTDDTNGNTGGIPADCSLTLGASVIRLRPTGMSWFTPAGGSTVQALSGSLGTNNGAVSSSGGNSSNTGGVGGPGSDCFSPDIGSGAGAGGGITAANVASAGGLGGFHRVLNSSANGGVVDGALPAVSSAGVDGTGNGFPGCGGGGGAASITTAAQAGADGVGYGAPGAGGGASLNGFASGRGGNGGPSYLRMEWVYA